MNLIASKFLVSATAAILVLGGLAIALYPQVTDAQYAVQQWQMDHSTEASAPVKAGGIKLPEGAVARIEIPAIHLKAYVVEGTGHAQLNRGPGHYPKTPLPGEHGNACIAAHRTMYGHAFHDLNKLKPGDVIRTGTSACTAVYRVVRIHVVDDSEVSVADPTRDDRLTLTTCHPIGSAAQRLVVVAERTN